MRTGYPKVPLRRERAKKKNKRDALLVQWFLNSWERGKHNPYVADGESLVFVEPTETEKIQRQEMATLYTKQRLKEIGLVCPEDSEDDQFKKGQVPIKGEQAWLYWILPKSQNLLPDSSRRFSDCFGLWDPLEGQWGTNRCLEPPHFCTNLDASAPRPRSAQI
jgi:hypothetical protein